MATSERPLNRYTLPGRLKPLGERDIKHQPLTTLPAWAEVIGTIDTMLNNSNDFKDLRHLVEKQRPLLNRYYNAYFDIAAGKGWKKLYSIRRDLKNGLHNPETVKDLEPVISKIKGCFPANKPRR
jgi:hypothetical protein